MNIEQTLTIIKPDAVAAGKVGAIITRLEDEGFRFLGIKFMRLSKPQAQSFYGIHKAKPFFDNLVKFITNGPVVVAVIERENAIQHLRDLMGPTDSMKAPPDTLRGKFGSDIEKNAIHGSDSPETAAFEISFFFSGSKLVSNARRSNE